MGMNNVTIGGNLARDPEVRDLQSGTKVAHFTVAVSKRGQEGGTDFFPCAAWGKLAELVGNRLKKGSKVAVMGYLQNREFEGSNGEKKKVTEINAQDMLFFSSEQDKSEKPQAAGQPQQPSFLPPRNAIEEDDLPW